jgi:transposase
MGEVTTIGLDIAKSVFQAHGADASGSVVFRKKLGRSRLLAFFAQQPRCVVAMEACAGAHHWGRELMQLGYTVRLIPPAYVKPFVKRQKNDAADAEAICEAAQRPTMRFVPVKSVEQQASGVVFRARDLLVHQRTQIMNALRGHLAEYGHVAPKGVMYVDRLVVEIEDSDSELPQAARTSLQTMVRMLDRLDTEIAVLDVEIARRAKEDAVARRLMTIPGIGPVTAAALVALAPAPESFRCGRDFSAWVGLTPLQRSTGGKQKLGRADLTTTAGDRRERRDQAGAASRCAGGLLAGPDARSQAAHAGRRRLGQQDRPDRLGAAGERRGLPSSGAGGLTAVGSRGVEA